ncbi:MAG: DNA repair protein RecN [Lachnospiraceae bacterium]|nr:DNA repair protein RecN [Lachnospiraceae bacterium]
MLQSLYVKNLALIDEAEIDFTEGLNILTGETGAGKSVLIGSINLALGEKADASMIRDGADSALIEMTFHVSDDLLRAQLREMEIPVEDDGMLVLKRRIYHNRSSCKVLGETVSLKQMRQLAERLINIHGQNDHLEMMSRKRQLALLDDYGKEKTAPLKERLAASFGALQEIREQYRSMDTDAQTRQREADLIRYEIDEIDRAALTEGEDDTLEEEFRKRSAFEKIAAALQNAHRFLAGDEGAADLAAAAFREVSDAVRMDDALSDVSAQLSDAETLLREAARTVADYMDTSSHDEARLNEISERLNLINRLKAKYDEKRLGIAAILSYRDEREERLRALEDHEAHMARLKKEIEKRTEEALAIAKELSAERKRIAGELTGRLTEAMEDLNFAAVSLSIEVESDAAHLTAGGMDEVTFLISTNPGEKMRPLEKVASGGELSRIMLAIRTVISESSEELSMIFDEIDAGISGKTAWKVSGKLGDLSVHRQVICITHLAQIAAMADTHFCIRKEVSEGRSVTRIQRLSEEEGIRELARLTGTDQISDAALESARKMRREALERKKEKRGH